MPPKKDNGISWVLLVLVAALDAFVWYEIVFQGPAGGLRMYFLDVGQGDGELVVLPGGVRVLIDAGPDASVVKRVEDVLGTRDRYIDLAVITHPQLDHFNGFNELLGRYTFGAFIVNGRDDPPSVRAWYVLKDSLRDARVPVVTIMAGDRIRNGSATVDIFSPDDVLLGSKELNDTGIVMLLHTPFLRALFTADIGFKVESYLMKKFDIHADVLKVGHHGSKYSSGSAFLRAVSPKVAVIEVGRRNRYGHPTKEALVRLSPTHVFRTDQNGTVEVTEKDGVLRVFTER